MSDFSSMQEMVKNPIDQIPWKFVVHDQEPAISVSSNDLEIPVIDMNTLQLDEETNKAFHLDKLHHICKHWGIFQLVNHGIDTSLLEKVKYEIEEFYDLPLEEKSRFKIKPGDVEGYGQTIIHSSHEKVDWADRFYLTTNPVHRRKPHLFPALPSSIRETLETYILELQKLSDTLLGLIAETLNIDKREVMELFDDGMQSMRMNYYPPCPEPNKVIGLTAHSDAGGITILQQVNGVDGFQVKKDGVWIPVKILPDAFVVNLGDIFEILSNGLYKSVEHRAVVNSEKERITIAMFFNPNLESQIGPLPSLLRDDQPPLFKCFNFQDYLNDFFSRRLNGKSFLEHMKIET